MYRISERLARKNVGKFDIAVINLRAISNFTDFDAFEDRIMENATDNDIVEAVRAGTLSMEELDEAVSHVLEMVFNYVEHKQSGTFDMEKDHAESGRIAEESCVLLKNEGAVLPVKAPADKVLFVGCFAENPRYGGGGSSKIKCYKMTSAVEAAREAGLAVKYVKGYN